MCLTYYTSLYFSVLQSQDWKSNVSEGKKKKKKKASLNFTSPAEIHDPFKENTEATP